MTEATSNSEYQPAEDQPIEDQPVRLRFASPQEQADFAANPEGYQASPGPNEVIRFPGTGLPPDQVQLKSTNIKSYGRDSEIAKMEAEVTKARYGGSSIQDSAAVASPPPYGKPKAVGTDASGMPVNNRNRFESEVYKEIGGNPFEINAVKKMNEVTAKDLPALFSRVFKGQVVWEDRNKLDKNQRAYWDAQVKGYRAHVKEAVESERKTKIDVYNHMMKTFDNDVKENEAAEKRVKEREKEWAATRKEDRTESKDTEKRVSDLQKNKRDILKRMGELMKDPMGGAERAPAGSAEKEFNALSDQLEMINSESDKILMATNPEYRAKRTKELNEPAVAPAPVEPKSVPAPAAATVKQELPAYDIHGGGDADVARASSSTPAAAPVAKVQPAPVSATPQPKTSAPKFKPHPNGKPLEVRRDKNGRLLGKFEDGSIAWLDEVK